MRSIASSAKIATRVPRRRERNRRQIRSNRRRRERALRAAEWIEHVIHPSARPADLRYLPDGLLHPREGALDRAMPQRRLPIPARPLECRRARPLFARSFSLLLILAVCAVSHVGCTKAYYSAMEQLGQHKRDILRSRIEAGREDQEEAQEQIKTTYERFKEAAGYDGGDFEAVYKNLNGEYERSRDRAEAVSDRIESIEAVAQDLFDEWESESELIGTTRLRNESRKSLDQTRARYAKLIGAMKRAESKMPPVLDAFRDQVLFMKHSLNAQAIASLEGTVGEIENDVETLIRDIDASILEAERFLEELDDA